MGTGDHVKQGGREGADVAFDVVVIGSGPAGHAAAVTAARAKKRVLVVEESRTVGGACVERGTIPSKTLRETAVAFASFKRRTGGVLDVAFDEGTRLTSLMTRLGEVLEGHHQVRGHQLERDGVTVMHGRAAFASPHELEVRGVGGRCERVSTDRVVIATGSVPRAPGGVPIDHENVFDSDSLLSIPYLPETLIVIGAGVIAAEYASIFAALGVRVTMIDKAPRPLAWCDPEIVEVFLRAFEATGSRFIGGVSVANVAWDGVSSVEVTLEGGETLRAEKAVYAMGRVANLRGLKLDLVGLAPNARGLLEVDEDFRTRVPHVLAVGDVIGPPSLASTSAEQGRRAMAAALGATLGPAAARIPAAVYTIPELATVGMTEADAQAKLGGATVGRADFRELSRGRIAGVEHGLIKLVAGPDGRRLVGAQIVGEGASELVHVGQMALAGGLEVDAFVDHVFNFPTLAEGYRVAALDLIAARERRS